MEAWQRLFGAIQEQLLGLAPIASDEFESFKARAVSNIGLGVTPRKQIARYADDREGESPWEPSNMVAKLSPLGSSLLEDIDSESLIAAQMDKLLVACKETMTKFEKMRLAVGEDVDRLEAGIHEISLRTGKDPGLSDTPLLSAWEGVAFVHASMQEALAAAGALHSEMAASRRRIEEVEAYTMKANATFSQFNKQMGQQGQLLNLLATENQRLQAILQSHPPAQPPVSAAGITPSLAGDFRLSEMENQIKVLEARLLRAEISTQAASTVSSGAAVGGTVADFRELQMKLATIEARVSSTPITVCGRTFLSLPDVEAWVVKNAPAGVFYFYHDAVSLLELLNSTDMIRSEVLTELYQAHKVGLKAEAEARMIASFRITVPQVFCGSQKETGLATSTKPFPACKTYEQWDPSDGYSGLKHMIERGMIDIRGTLMHDISTMLATHPEARSFATDLHGVAHTFVSNYCTFLSNFYAEMRQASGCGSEEAWNLTTKVGKVVFEEFRRVRNIAVNANTETDQVKKTAKYLYAIIPLA